MLAFFMAGSTEETTQNTRRHLDFDVFRRQVGTSTEHEIPKAWSILAPDFKRHLGNFAFDCYAFDCWIFESSDLGSSAAI